MRFHAVVRRAAVLSMALAAATPLMAQTQVYVVDPGTVRVPGTCLGSLFIPCLPPTVHLINAATGHDLGSFPAAPLHDLVTSLRLSSDGRLLFLTISAGFTTPGDRLSIVDASTRLVVAEVAVGVTPRDVAILPDNSRAYVVNSGDNSVSVVDLMTFSAIATVAVQSRPERIVAAPDGSAVYVTNRGSGTISKIATSNNAVAATINVGAGPHGLDISPDGSRLFVANSESNSVSVIDAGNDSVLRALPAGSTSAPPEDVSAQSATRVYVLAAPAFTQDSTNSGSVFQLNTADGAVVGSTLIGSGVRLARDSSGTPTFVTGGSPLKRLASDGSSFTEVGAGAWAAAAVVTDPCSFEATATATVFGPSGGSGVLTIPAPAGCAWTIDPSGFAGMSVTAPLSGTGPGTRAFTVGTTSVVKTGIISIQRQTIAFEQTIPRMNVELAPGGTVLQQPFTVTGWALDENAIDVGPFRLYSGVDQVHVWAYPAGGASPILVGLATYGVGRPDIAAIYGAKYRTPGFSISVNNLPTGTYTLAFFAHSSRSNTFSNAQAVNVSVVRQPAFIAIDTPRAGPVGSTFIVAGWAADPNAAGAGPGVDAVHVWAYPSTGAAPVFLGAAAYRASRPDVSALLGPSFQNSGYGLNASLPPGDYTLVVFARSTDTRQFSSQTVRITVQ